MKLVDYELFMEMFFFSYTLFHRNHVNQHLRSRTHTKPVSPLYRLVVIKPRPPSPRAAILLHWLAARQQTLSTHICINGHIRRVTWFAVASRCKRLNIVGQHKKRCHHSQANSSKHANRRHLFTQITCWCLWRSFWCCTHFMRLCWPIPWMRIN